MQHLISSFKRYPFLVPLFLAAACVPLLALPWFVDSYEVHKATFTIIAAMLAGMLFLARAMRERSLSLAWSWPAFSPLFFFLATVLSALFSASPATSWLGLGGGDYASVLFAGSCVFIALLLAQAPERSLLSLRSVRILWAIEAFLVIVALLAVLVGILPLSSSLSFGTPHALAIFLAIAALCFMGDISEGTAKPGSRVLGFVLLFAFFIVAFFLDAWILWLPFFLVGIMLLSFTLAKSQGPVGVARIFPATLLILLPLVGWFLPHIFQGLFPAEIVPSFSLSLDIAKNVWGDGLGFLVGSGPGTYGISYALYALPTVNATVFWNIIFERGFSHILTLATTGGLLTVLSFVGMQIVGFVVGFRAWARAQKDERGIVLGFYLAFTFLSLSAWTYSWNTVVVFLFFVLFGILLALAPHRVSQWSFASSTQASVAASFGFVTSLVVLSLAFFVAGTRYAAEISYAQAISLAKSNASSEEILMKVDQAASFNRWNDVYYRELALLLLQEIDDLVAEQASPEQVQAVLSAAVNSAVRATEIGPNVVKNWEVRGNVYREVAPAVANAADFSVASFTTATQLAPNNPLYLVGLGRAYLAKADLLSQVAQTEDEALQAEATAARDESLAYAEEAFVAAVNLKADYTAARYFLSAVYERQGKLADAVKSMEVVRALSTEDVGVGMQLALLYLRQGKNDLAKAELERVIELSPTYANARWYLSVILEQEGDLEGALAQVAEIVKTNPDNEAVQQRLERLQSGEVEDDTALPEPLPEEEGVPGEESSDEAAASETSTTP